MVAALLLEKGEELRQQQTEPRELGIPALLPAISRVAPSALTLTPCQMDLYSATLAPCPTQTLACLRATSSHSGRSAQLCQTSLTYQLPMKRQLSVAASVDQPAPGPKKDQEIVCNVR